MSIYHTKNHTIELLLIELLPLYYRYIYIGRVDLQSIDQALGLCYVAQKYMLPFLVQQCIQYMKDNLSAPCTCAVLEFSKLIDDEHLKVSNYILFWSYILN